MTNDFVQAIHILREGKLITFPSETVYALACDAANPSAVEQIFAVKGRDHEKRLAVMCASLEAAQRIANFSAEALALAEDYWPGPLTLVLPLKEGHGLAQAVYGGSGSIAIRIPDHPVALALLDAYGAPVVATSANLSGNAPALTAREVYDALGDKVAYIIDGGKARIGEASTIIDTTVSPSRVLRQGSVRIEREES